MKKTRHCEKCGEPYKGDGRYKYCDKHRNKPSLRERKYSECRQCGEDITDRHFLAEYCFPCTFERKKKCVILWQPQNDNEIARKMTAYAVKIGFLPPPTDFECVDCHWRMADCYDHRDYNNPLDVEPVCIACNSSRGKGIPFHSPIKSQNAA